jgi:hypothetical protein
MMLGVVRIEERRVVPVGDDAERNDEEERRA